MSVELRLVVKVNSGRRPSYGGRGNLVKLKSVKVAAMDHVRWLQGCSSDKSHDPHL